MRIIKDSPQGFVDVSHIRPVPTAVIDTRMQSVFDPRVSKTTRRELADTLQVSREAEVRIRQGVEP